MSLARFENKLFKYPCGYYLSHGFGACSRDYGMFLFIFTASRVLPQRAWAASLPTLLSHEAFERLLTPSVLSNAERIPGNLMSPIERFLCCVHLRRIMQRYCQTLEQVRNFSSKANSMLHAREPVK